MTATELDDGYEPDNRHEKDDSSRKNDGNPNIRRVAEEDATKQVETWHHLLPDQG